MTKPMRVEGYCFLGHYSQKSDEYQMQRTPNVSILGGTIQPSIVAVTALRTKSPPGSPSSPRTDSHSWAQPLHPKPERSANHLVHATFPFILLVPITAFSVTARFFCNTEFSSAVKHSLLQCRILFYSTEFFSAVNSPGHRPGAC